MGVTRKERFLKAMLEDNAEACGGGVTREEKLIASAAKKVCDNDALEGGGGSGGRVLFLDHVELRSEAHNAKDYYTKNLITASAFKDAFEGGTVYIKGDVKTDMVVGYWINSSTSSIACIETGAFKADVQFISDVVFAQE